jgi:hypothetical protein
MAPLEAYAGFNIGRMSIDKNFTGNLAGTSQNGMLTAMTNTPGSAGYVATEKFLGTLKDKANSFALQHHARRD